MRILVIPGSYKSTIKSIIAADTIANAIQEVLPSASIKKLVIADGGEGTLEVFRTYWGCNINSYYVKNPLGKVVLAQMGFLDPVTAVIESSQAIGFSLLDPSEFNPFLASSYGVGELIKYAVEIGAKKILVTMGDSSTMDMGVGMLHALGVEFFTSSGESISPTLSNLSQITHFDDTKIRTLRESVEFRGLVDTNDYLCGEVGQVQLYGKQKGLIESDIPIVEAAFFQFSTIIKKRFGIDVTKVVRATGSGGLAATLHTFLNANLINTLDYLSERLAPDASINEADVVITGEGCLDNQTKLGKVPYYVASRCKRKCIGIFGRYTEEGFSDMTTVCRGFLPFTMNPELALRAPRSALETVTRSIFSVI